jgi:hypothetical protein
MVDFFDVCSIPIEEYEGAELYDKVTVAIHFANNHDRHVRVANKEEGKRLIRSIQKRYCFHLDIKMREEMWERVNILFEYVNRVSNNEKLFPNREACSSKEFLEVMNTEIEEEGGDSPLNPLSGDAPSEEAKS